MKVFFTILICRLLRFVGKLIGKGSSFPGQVALKLCPDILSRVQLPACWRLRLREFAQQESWMSRSCCPIPL